jgi:hypothetical protein
MTGPSRAIVDAAFCDPVGGGANLVQHRKSASVADDEVVVDV